MQDRIPWNKPDQRQDPAEYSVIKLLIYFEKQHAVTKQDSTAIAQVYEVLKCSFSNESSVDYGSLLIQLENRVANSVSRKRKALLTQKMAHDGA
ncbi:hypothetical protein SNE40_003752 [Patella caerulea]|uniref:Uncharacterized protein n=1 Tax=Patella caerulea TaxID=87958 RepID=A0AAN8KIW4_PATCE